MFYSPLSKEKTDPLIFNTMDLADVVGERVWDFIYEASQSTISAWEEVFCHNYDQPLTMLDLLDLAIGQILY